MPFYSIIIPTFNSGSKIIKCLESILAQTFSDFEIIIQDGESQDNTVALVSELLARNPLLKIKIKVEKDTGAYDAMNKAINHANGNWLLFLGSDDELYDEYVLEKAHNVLSQTQALFVYGNVKINGEGTWAKNGQVYDGEFSVKKLFETNISHQAIFYHKSIFSNLGNYNVDYTVCADWDLNHRCFANVKTEFMNIIVSNFFAGGISTVQQSDKFVTFDRVAKLKEYYSIPFTDNLFRPCAWTFYSNAKREFLKGRFVNSVGYMSLSFYHSQMRSGLFKIYIKDFLRGCLGRFKIYRHL